MGPQSKVNVLIIVVVTILIAAGGIFWYWRKSGMPSIPKEEGVGAKIFEQAQNPTKDKLPETNPFAADTNPFDAPVNPFKDEYKNPFK